MLGGQGVGLGDDTGDPGGPIPRDKELPGGTDKPEWGKDWREEDLAPGQGHQQGRGRAALKSLPEHFSRLIPGVSEVKHLPAMQETWVQSLGQEDPLEKEMATHSNILAWRIPWTEETGGLQSTGSQTVGHD